MKQLDNEVYKALLPFCISDKQHEVIEALIAGESQKKLAERLGVAASGVQAMVHRIRARAAAGGIAPDKDLYYPVADGQVITGTSTLQRSPAGNLQWVKTKTGFAEQIAMMRDAIESLAADVPRVEAAPQLNNAYADLLAVYPLGDPHIGMLSWGEESGADWDLPIAESKMLAVFKRLVDSAPPCKQAVIINLGDFFHADNMDAVTQRSGHKLDVDGRYAKMVRVGMRIMRAMIHFALERHETVRVINSVGNHDDTGSLFLSVALSNIYENEPRVSIDTSPAPFHYVRFGKVLIGAHHGHTCKMTQLAGVMAADRAKDWGETEFRYWLTGHIHHDSKMTSKEYPGASVESFRTLAAKDAYAAWGGYRARQDSKCIVFHKDYGEIDRHTICIEQVI